MVLSLQMLPKHSRLFSRTASKLFRKIRAVYFLLQTTFLAVFKFLWKKHSTKKPLPRKAAAFVFVVLYCYSVPLVLGISSVRSGSMDFA